MADDPVKIAGMYLAGNQSLDKAPVTVATILCFSPLVPVDLVPKDDFGKFLVFIYLFSCSDERLVLRQREGNQRRSAR